MGWTPTAPAQALRLYERWQTVQETGWTYAEYDATRASDLLLAREFAKIQRAAANRAAEKAKPTP